MTEVELPRELDSSAHTDRPTAILRRALWFSSRTGGFKAESAIPAWIKRTSCGRMTTEVRGNGEFS